MSQKEVENGALYEESLSFQISEYQLVIEKVRKLLEAGNTEEAREEAYTLLFIQSSILAQGLGVEVHYFPLLERIIDHIDTFEESWTEIEGLMDLVDQGESEKPVEEIAAGVPDVPQFTALLSKREQAQQAESERQDRVALEAQKKHERAKENHEKFAAFLRKFGPDTLYKIVSQFMEAINESETLTFSCEEGDEIRTATELLEVLGGNEKQRIILGGGFTLTKEEYSYYWEIAPGIPESRVLKTEFYGISLAVLSNGISVNGKGFSTPEQLVQELQRIVLEGDYKLLNTELGDLY